MQERGLFVLNKKNIYTLTQFILENKSKNNSAFDLFNEWRDVFNCKIASYEEALWIIEYIRMLLTTDTAIIEEAQTIDKKRFKGDLLL